MAQLPTQSQFGDYGEWPGRDVLDSGGQRLGGVREIYLDRETGRPEWVLVEVEGGDARFVPLADAAVESTTIRVAHSADVIRDAPGIGAEPRIDQSEEERLYAYYGLGYSAEESGSGLPAEEPVPEPEPPTSSWSDVAATNEAPPPPAEPPSPEEIERAEIPEPPATTDRASEPYPSPVDDTPATAPGEDVVATDPGDDDDAPDDDALATSPGDEARVVSPGDEPPADLSAVTPVAEPVLPPPPAATPPPERAEPKADVPPSRASAFPPPPPPPPEPSGGPLAVLSSRPGNIAAAVAVAVVLLWIIRRLR